MLSPSLLEDYHQTNDCFANIILNINKPLQAIDYLAQRY